MNDAVVVAGPIKDIAAPAMAQFPMGQQVGGVVFELDVVFVQFLLAAQVVPQPHVGHVANEVAPTGRSIGASIADHQRLAAVQGAGDRTDIGGAVLLAVHIKGDVAGAGGGEGHMVPLAGAQHRLADGAGRIGAVADREVQQTVGAHAQKIAAAGVAAIHDGARRRRALRVQEDPGLAGEIGGRHRHAAVDDHLLGARERQRVADMGGHVRVMGDRQIAKPVVDLAQVVMDDQPGGIGRRRRHPVIGDGVGAAGHVPDADVGDVAVEMLGVAAFAIEIADDQRLGRGLGQPGGDDVIDELAVHIERQGLGRGVEGAGHVVPCAVVDRRGRRDLVEGLGAVLHVDTRHAIVIDRQGESGAAAERLAQNALYAAAGRGLEGSLHRPTGQVVGQPVLDEDVIIAAELHGAVGGLDTQPARRVVDRRHVQGHGLDGRGQGAVGRLIGEAVGAVDIGVGHEDHRAAGMGHRVAGGDAGAVGRRAVVGLIEGAVGRQGLDGERDRVAVHVVAGQGYYLGRVFIGRRCQGIHCRRVVDGIDSDGNGAGYRRGDAVVGGDGQAVGAVEIEIALIGDGIRRAQQGVDVG